MTDNEDLQREIQRLQLENLHMQRELDIWHQAQDSGQWTLFLSPKGEINGCRWDDQMRRILGFESQRDFPDELSMLRQLVHTDDLTFTIPYVKAVIQDETDLSNFDKELRVRNKGGEYRWYRMIGRLVRHEDRTPAYMFGVFYDINSRREHEVRSRQYMRVIDALGRDNDTVWLMYPDHRVSLIQHDGTDRSQRVVNCFAKLRTYEECQSAYAHRFVAECDRERFLKDLTYDQILEKLKRHKAYRYTYLRDLGEQKEHYRVTYFRTHDFSWSGDIVMAYKCVEDQFQQEKERTELLEQKLQEELVLTAQLKEARQCAEEANKAKSTFLFNMSHDIRTPMNAILGFANLMEKHKAEPEKLSSYIRKIIQSGEYLLTIINDVLDMARIESGKVELDVECHNLLDISGSVVPLLADLLRNKEQHFEEVNNLKHLYVMADKTKLCQIFVNLLSNAIKYTPKGGHIVFTQMEEPCEEEGYGNYVLKVQDDGVGMSTEFAQHIFDNFARARTTTESKIPGTGLGMSIVKKLVDLIGATIEVDTELGRGTSIIIRKKFKLAAPPNRYLKDHLGEGQATISLRGKRILLAEDNELNAEIATEILRDTGAEVEHAHDGCECLKRMSEASAGHFDVILMDVQMPNMNGYEAARNIRALPDAQKAGIPILALTANAFESDRQKAEDAGMNGHLTKPIDIPQLMEALKQLLVG